MVQNRKDAIEQGYSNGHEWMIKNMKRGPVYMAGIFEAGEIQCVKLELRRTRFAIAYCDGHMSGAMDALDELTEERASLELRAPASLSSFDSTNPGVHVWDGSH
jgi:hypothetical protein